MAHTVAATCMKAHPRHGAVGVARGRGGLARGAELLTRNRDSHPTAELVDLLPEGPLAWRPTEVTREYDGLHRRNLR